MTGHLVEARSSVERQRISAVRRYAILDTPPDGAFDRVCALAARFFDVPFSSVTIVDEDRIWFKASKGFDVAQIPRSPGLCASAILDDKPYVISDGLSDPRTADNALVHGEMGVRFYAAAPIITSDGHRLGTVNVLDTKPRETTEQDVRTLRELAAIVVDELELRLAAIREIQREQDLRLQARHEQQRAENLARTLQRSLSPPSLPRIAGLDVAVHYEPFAIEEVGGDFYDHFPLVVGRSGFFLGDVCGKGAEAARITSLARYTIRTAAMHDQGPAAILFDLNAALLMESAETMQMCTAVYGEVDTSAGPGSATVTLAVAGHPAPLVVRCDGRVETTSAQGTILGAFDDPTFEVCQMQIDPGDAIVLYSDGILDIEADGVRVDEDRIPELLAGASPATAQTLVNRLAGVLQSPDCHTRDDVAIMVLRRMD